jgi:hypothetical protein
MLCTVDELRPRDCIIGRRKVRLEYVDIINLYPYTGCPKCNGPHFGRVFLMLNYSEKTQNTYVQS